MKRCKNCGGTDVEEQLPAWFDVNTGEHVDDDPGAKVIETYCNDCATCGVEVEEFDPEPEADGPHGPLTKNELLLAAAIVEGVGRDESCNTAGPADEARVDELAALALRLREWAGPPALLRSSPLPGSIVTDDVVDRLEHWARHCGPRENLRCATCAAMGDGAVELRKLRERLESLVDKAETFVLSRNNPKREGEEHAREDLRREIRRATR